ncbi:MAG: IS630 family transposase, partial [Planctomycetota bacterium]|nr:IS630 family transposase [Planctomycetota bacterium]MCX5655935.1 IS630 family transposase [Planctomycetota bacterium]MCX5656158.1 IS630 family transposase [Planctomycetota bacterium]
QLAARITPWECSRNDKKTGIDWRFTTTDARIKLKRLYPVI